jgi:folate-binding protein YgfZ
MNDTPAVAEMLWIEGADALAFAQAQFSSKVSALAMGQWQFSAWLSAHGRVRALFHLARISEQRLLLVLRGGQSAALAEALKPYLFRARVALDASASRALRGGPAYPLHSLHHMDDGASTGMLALGCGTHSMLLADTAHADRAWYVEQLLAGWPWLAESSLNNLLPSSLALQRLGAVAIDKGCYPGQEIVARMHYRGGQKRHLHRVQPSQALNSGSILIQDNRDIGCVLQQAIIDGETQALVVLRDEVVERSEALRLITLDNGCVLQMRDAWEA